MIALDKAPPQMPPWDPDSDYWGFWDWDYRPYIVEPFPTEHMLGKTSLDYGVIEAVAVSEQGQHLTPEHEEALSLVNEYPYYDDAFENYDAPVK